MFRKPHFQPVGIGLTFVALILTGSACTAPEALGSQVLGSQGPGSAVGPQVEARRAVQIVRGEWRDAARGDRIVPYKLYLPTGGAPAPVVIFSHGVGGSREGAAFLLQYLAENGIAAVAIQHPGTDVGLLAGANGTDEMIARLRPAVGDPRSAVARFGDIRFVIDRLIAENASGPLVGRLDMERLGMSGHSYGALTTLVAVGQRLNGPLGDAFQDPRIDAAIVYSPNAPRNQDPEAALGAVRTPILHFTGTEDRSPFDLETTPEGRQIPFRTLHGADQYLIVFEGGDHMIYSGRVQSGGAMTEAQRRQTEAIERETLTFWRAYLMGDARAMADLCGIPGRISPIGVGEVKADRCGLP